MAVENNTLKHRLNATCDECGKQFYAYPCRKRRGLGRFCSNKCRTNFIHGTPIERLYRTTEKLPNGCEIWTGIKSKEGYGQLKLKYEQKSESRAHRISWILHNGPIPDGMCVCHSCDNPPCINPDHLFLGTNADNVRDCVSKGRTLKGDRSWARTHPELVLRGGQCGRTKLTSDHVREIRARHALGENPNALAKEFRVSLRNIRSIALRESWRHI
jgi:hypothetical protein